MISLYARVEIPHRKLFGRVVARNPVPNAGIMYRILIETDDGAHVEALYGASSVREVVGHGGYPGGNVVAMPVRRVPLRLAAVDGRAL
jgi:hypothetical protein